MGAVRARPFTQPQAPCYQGRSSMIRGGLEYSAGSAILSCLPAWPGMDAGPLHYGDCMRLLRAGVVRQRPDITDHDVVQQPPGP
jgi:hypothetical protein